MTKQCKIDGCTYDGDHWRAGYCSPHYQRIRKYGDPDVVNKSGRKRERHGCTVDGCTRPHSSNGWCKVHQNKADRNGGDPLGTVFVTWQGKSYYYGDVPQLAADIAAQGGEDCITWPGSRSANGNGYGDLRVNGKTHRAHRYILDLVEPCPDPALHALHRCGNGAEGCVNPGCLYWGTQSDNMRDAVRHGTHGGLKANRERRGQA
jgi:hypothetical protein